MLWPDLLGRSQLSAAPDLLPQPKKRLLVMNVTEGQTALARDSALGMGMAEPPIRPQIGDLAFHDRPERGVGLGAHRPAMRRVDR